MSTTSTSTHAFRSDVPSPNQYVNVWQTWNLVYPRVQSTPASALALQRCSVDVDTPNSSESATLLRQRVQQARIQQRMSIATLASESMSTPESIAAFERGDGVLSTDVRERVFKILKLR